MIIERFERQVLKYPDKFAIKTETGVLTYNDLDRLSNQIANSIYTAAGGRPFHIGLLLDDSREMIAAMLASIKSGNVYVPLVKDYPAKRINYMVEHAEIRIMVTDKINIERLKNTVSDPADVCFLLVENMTDSSYRLNFQRTVCSGETAYILYTSGSTGVPKGVLQTYRNILYFIDRYSKTLHLTSEDNLTLFSSFSHDAAVVDIFAALLNGATLLPLDLKKEEIFSKLPQWLNDERISVYHSVPTVFRYFLAALKEIIDFPALRFIVLGGEAVLKSDIERFNSFFSHASCQLYNLYGQTESTYNAGQFFKPDSTQNDIVITLGDVIDGTQLFVVNEEGDELGKLEVGEIVVMSPYVSPGYWKDDKNTAEKFTDTEDSDGNRVYFTGDTGRCLLDGRIEYMGRKDNQIKLRGYRVELGEIENTVMQLENVTQAAAVPIDTPSGEKFIACYFTAKKDIDLSRVREFLQERLMDYMIPTFFKQMEKMPVTVSGKIDRKALPAPEILINEEYVPPGTEVEKKLAGIWPGF